MKVVKESTYLGKQLIARGSRYEGTELYQIYDKWSSAKQRAFDWCYEQYLASEEHEAFSIISHNSWGLQCIMVMQRWVAYRNATKQLSGSI